MKTKKATAKKAATKTKSKKAGATKKAASKPKKAPAAKKSKTKKLRSYTPGTLLDLLKRMKLIAPAVGAVVLGGVAWHHYSSGVRTASVEVGTDLPQTVAPETTVAAATGVGDFDKTQGMGFQERIQYWSELLATEPVARERVLSFARTPEGMMDSAPLIPEKFDCTTYVETVVALSQSQKPEDFVTRLMAIRYKNSKPTYFDRNHFPEADWIPNNEKAGILKDVTAQVAAQAKVQLGTQKKEINRGEWYATNLKRLGVNRSVASVSGEPTATWSAPVEVEVPYLPIDQVEQALKHIPDGVVVNFVRKYDARQPVAITHQGFIIRKGDKLFLRHASVGGKIKTMGLPEYLYDFNKRDGRKWPLVGINLNQISAN